MNKMKNQILEITFTTGARDVERVRIPNVKNVDICNDSFIAEFIGNLAGARGDKIFTVHNWELVEV